MSYKQAMFYAVGLVGAALLFALVYSLFRPVSAPSLNTLTQKENRAITQNQLTSEKTTPDTVSDVIAGQVQEDATAFDDAQSDEMKNIEEGSQSVNELNNVYDENEIQ